MLDMILIFCFLNNTNERSYPPVPPPYLPYRYTPPAHPFGNGHPYDPQQSRRMKAASGAIAYSTDKNAYGFSFSQPGKQRAEQIALMGCQQHAADCKIQGSFENACAALAVSASGKTYFAQGRLASAVRQLAFKQCAEKNASCHVKVHICSFSN